MSSENIMGRVKVTGWNSVFYAKCREVRENLVKRVWAMEKRG